ncbi:MAG: phasin family protein [Massilia sp.]
MPNYTDNAAMRSQMENQSRMLNELSQKTYEAMRRVGEINMKMSQQLMEDGMNMGREMMSCGDPLQMVSAAMKQLQPVTQHLRSYQEQLMGALAGMQLDLTRSAEQSVPGAVRSVGAVADDMVRNASVTSMAEAAGYTHDGANGAAPNPT